MKIGILFEGDYDEEPLYEISKKIIFEVKPELKNINFIYYAADGNIEGYINPALFFFLHVNKCDICIVASDSDNNPHKCKRIRQKTTTIYKSINPNGRIVFAFPNPELEQWFFDEAVAIKQTLLLSPIQRIPYSTLSPKERFHKLIEESKAIDISESKKDIYRKVAKSINLKLLKKTNSFNTFFSEFRASLIF